MELLYKIKYLNCKNKIKRNYFYYFKGKPVKSCKASLVRPASIYP